MQRHLGMLLLKRWCFGPLYHLWLAVHLVEVGKHASAGRYLRRRDRAYQGSAVIVSFRSTG